MLDGSDDQGRNHKTASWEKNIVNAGISRETIRRERRINAQQDGVLENMFEKIE